MSRTLVVVANKAKMRLFAVEGNGALKELSEHLNPEAHARGRDIGPHFDMIAGTGSLDSAVSVNEDEVENFARAIARQLELERNTNQLEKVYLVAPPQFLGELRGQVPQSLIAGEVTKDLLNARPEEIRTHLPDFL